MKPLAFGVLGVGYLGRIHARLAAGLPEINLVGVFDKNQDVCQEIAQICQTTACRSQEELLAQVDAVSIVVPTLHHYEVARAALEAGCHVFLEKPMTSTVSEAQQLLELAGQKGLAIQVGHIERFNPALLALKEYEIAPVFIESHRLSQFNPRGTDVSVLLDLMIHDLDIILTLVKSPVSSIDACGVQVVSPDEDICNVRLVFENGAVANITASRISLHDMRRMRIFQPNMYIGLDFLKKKAEIYSLSENNEGQGVPLAAIGTGSASKTIYYNQPQPLEVNALEIELKEFARSIRTGTPPRVSGEDGLRVLELAADILEQMRSRYPNLNSQER